MISKREKPLIALDLTGVLEDSWPYKRNWFLRKGVDLGPIPLSLERILQISKCDEKTYISMKQEVYSDQCFAMHPAVADSVRGVSELSQRFRVSVVTTRVQTHRISTEQWLYEKGFSNYLDSLVMLGVEEGMHEAPPYAKIQWCIDNGAIALVDDTLDNLVPENGTELLPFRRVLFNGEENITAPSSILQVHNWAALIKIFNNL